MSRQVHGKGRKERATPLTAYTVTTLARWFREYDCGPTDPVFPTRRGRPLSTDAVAWLLTKHAATAARRCPSLNDKHLTPHVLRHTAAMQLLHSGVDISVIALWLGHYAGDLVIPEGAGLCQHVVDQWFCWLSASG